MGPPDPMGSWDGPMGPHAPCKPLLGSHAGVIGLIDIARECGRGGGGAPDARRGKGSESRSLIVYLVCVSRIDHLVLYFTSRACGMCFSF